MLRWFIPALVPAALFAVLVHRSDRNREPPFVLAGTFVFTALLALGAFWIEGRAAAFTGLDGEVSAAGAAGSLLFVFFFVAPVHEATKVAGMWPAFRSRHFDEPYDGVVYSSVAALGFATVENALMLRAHPSGLVWFARALLALPAHVFFAATWGYALGRARQVKRPGAIFPAAWLVATLAHGLYTYLVYGRGAGALVATAPLLVAMGGLAVLAARDLRSRGERASRVAGGRLSRPSVWDASAPPSLRSVRAALRRADQPIMVRWIVFGTFVTIGAMIAFVASSIALGHWAHIDFSVVDERDIATTAPVSILGAGLLLAFPVSGFLIARASGLPTLLEPALATAAAIVTTLVVLGLAAPIALLFGLAFSPVLWALACAGAWIGRPVR
jgi:RsiW-degrading membrane proteinase PrsW (M82 family)